MRFDNAAAAAAARYTSLLGAFQAIFAQAMGDANPGSPRTQARVRAQAYNLAEVYLTTEADYITTMVVNTVGDSANRETLTAMGLLDEPITAAIHEHLVTRADDLQNALRVQLERDIAAIARGLQQVALRARLVARGRGVASAVALTTLRQHAATTSALVSFQHVDRAQRRWPSDNLVRTIWRHALVLAWNETAMLTMTDHGVTEARIEHPDPQHRDYGTVISLIEQPGLLDWPTVREDVFHPNSESWLVPNHS